MSIDIALHIQTQSNAHTTIPNDIFKDTFTQRKILIIYVCMCVHFRLLIHKHTSGHTQTDKQ